MHHRSQQGAWLAQVVRGYFAYHAVHYKLGIYRSFPHHWLTSRCCCRDASARGSPAAIKQSLILLPQPKILLPCRAALCRQTLRVGAVCPNGTYGLCGRE